MNSTVKASIGFALIILGLGWIGVRVICLQGPNIMYKGGVMISFDAIYSSQCRN